MDDFSTLAHNILKQRVEVWQTFKHKAIVDEFVLKHGEIFEAITTNNVVRKAPKECFSNAARLTLHDARFCYVEGYACNFEIGFLFLHAWTIHNDKVYDNTLENPNNYAYFGIRFDDKFVLGQMARYKVFGILGGKDEQILELIKHTEPAIWRPKKNGSIRRSA